MKSTVVPLECDVLDFTFGFVHVRSARSVMQCAAALQSAWDRRKIYSRIARQRLGILPVTLALPLQYDEGVRIDLGLFFPLPVPSVEQMRRSSSSTSSSWSSSLLISSQSLPSPAPSICTFLPFSLSALSSNLVCSAFSPARCAPTA